MFISESSWKVRGITRNPKSSNANAFAEKGVEIFRADLNDTSSLVAAFQGAHAIFAVTDFWASVTDLAAQKAAAEAGKVINEYVYDVEVQQGKNIVDAASESSVLTTLERFVYSSLLNARKWSRGKYMCVYHFDGKAVVVDYVQGKKKELAERMSTV